MNHPRSEGDDRPSAAFEEQEEPQETLAELLGDVLDLSEEINARITDEEVRGRVQRILRRVADDPSGSDDAPGGEDASSGGTAGGADHDPAWDLLPMRRVVARALLDERDIHLLTLLAEGLPTSGVAMRLDVAEPRVRDEVHAICQRIGVDKPIHAVVWAAQQDLLPRVVPRSEATTSGFVDEPRPPYVPAGPPTASTFWDSLTARERAALGGIAEEVRYSRGEVLWREGEVADEMLVIRSGWVRIFTERDGTEHTVAFRGPGEVIGERAALLLRERSATVVALDEVSGLCLGTMGFARFASAHPRVLAILEREIYNRLTDKPGAVPPGPPELSRRVEVGGFREFTGQVCSILFTDIAGFGAAERTDGDRASMRAAMYDMLRDSMDASGVPWDGCIREDRGDGALIVVPPWIPTSPVFDAVVDRLAPSLRRHNRGSPRARNLRLRVVVHVGPVMADSMGIAGAAIIHAARLLDLPAFRERFAASGADLALITSPFVYDSVIAQGPADAAPFEPVQGRVKDMPLTGWMRLADEREAPRPRPAPPPAPASTPLPVVLSQREAEIVELVTAGYTDAEIADWLKLEEDTVRERLRRIRRKYPSSQPDPVPLGLTLADLDRRLAVGA
ncbi:cyclic nucleotide-binding domain-containing protein [Actinomadura sp. SCN-SB]|uniref:cyclic nucleotide-binding domain-containing protein n=1 Tax=Actinomadura sp. SCN-SB TaxID=3373092 RepID=UPI0037527B16